MSYLRTSGMRGGVRPQHPLAWPRSSSDSASPSVLRSPSAISFVFKAWEHAACPPLICAGSRHAELGRPPPCSAMPSELGPLGRAPWPWHFPPTTACPGLTPEAVEHPLGFSWPLSRIIVSLPASCLLFSLVLSKKVFVSDSPEPPSGFIPIMSLNTFFFFLFFTSKLTPTKTHGTPFTHFVSLSSEPCGPSVGTDE